MPASGSGRPTRNGLPHFDGRATTTVFSGFRHPFRRLNWMRSGIGPPMTSAKHRAQNYAASMRLRVGVIVLLALMLEGCASAHIDEGSAQTWTPSEQPSPSASAPAFAWREVAVSSDCAASFKAAEDEAIATEGASDVALIQTGSTCPTVDEWLSALKARPGAFGMTEQATIDPKVELSSLCYPARDIPVCRDAEARGLSVFAK